MIRTFQNIIMLRKSMKCVMFHEFIALFCTSRQSTTGNATSMLAVSVKSAVGKWLY